MLTFFRRIRRKLANQNKVVQYSRYAIGEIILVMVGILLALQVNNWNEDRKDVHREIKMLTDLRNDIKYNIENINVGITILQEGSSHSQNILIAFEKQIKYDSKMIKDFEFYDYFWDPDFRYASFENLKQEGVNLISNDSLRNEIIELYEIDMDILDVSDLNNFSDYMTSLGYRIVNKHLYKERKTGHVLPFDYEKMMSDHEYYSFASYILSGQHIALEKSNKFIEKAQALNEYINEEIKKLQ